MAVGGAPSNANVETMTKCETKNLRERGLAIINFSFKSTLHYLPSDQITNYGPEAD